MGRPASQTWRSSGSTPFRKSPRSSRTTSSGLAQEVAAGSAIEGLLKPLDIDHFRIKGPPGQRFTLDLEDRRIGTSISPVVTLFSSSGRSLAQGRESRGGDRDCRMSLVLPDDGLCLVQVRDNTYGGSELARYRLRIDPAPYASAIFPLGGPKGGTIEVEVSGGNLVEARRKTITLPDAPGSFVDPGDFDGPGGPVTVPMRLDRGRRTRVDRTPRPAREAAHRCYDRRHRQRPDRQGG